MQFVIHILSSNHAIVKRGDFLPSKGQKAETNTHTRKRTQTQTQTQRSPVLHDNAAAKPKLKNKISNPSNPIPSKQNNNSKHLAND